MKALALILSLATLPVHAMMIGTVEGPEARIDFFDDAGLCLGDARRVEFVPVKGQTIPGCWLMSADGSVLRAVFLDGDVVPVPTARIKPAKAV